MRIKVVILSLLMEFQGGLHPFLNQYSSTMKSIFSFCSAASLTGMLLLFIQPVCNAQEWSRQFGTDKEEYARNHVTDAQGNSYVSGNTYGNMDGENAGQRDGFLCRFDSLGNLQWSRQFGSAGDEDVQWSAISNDGYIYITGSTTGSLNGNNRGKEDFFVTKYNREGQQLWMHQFGTDSIDVAFGIFADNKGFVYVGGITLGILQKPGKGLQDAFLVKLDPDGNLLVTQQFGTPANDGCAAVTGDNTGHVFLTGSTFGDLNGSSYGFLDVFTASFSEQGEPLQFNQFGSEGFDVPTCISVDPQQNLWVGGSTSGNFANTQAGEGDCFIAKISAQGTLLWKDQFGTEKNDGVKAIAMNPKYPGIILFSGLKNLPPAHAWIRSYKSTGTLQWEKTFGDGQQDTDASGKDISLDDHGNIVHIGLTRSALCGPPIGSADVYLIRMRLPGEAR